jgi:hypothetical protein
MVLDDSWERITDLMPLHVKDMIYWQCGFAIILPKCFHLTDSHVELNELAKKF